MINDTVQEGVYGECGKHPGNNLANCIRCKAESHIESIYGAYWDLGSDSNPMNMLSGYIAGHYAGYSLALQEKDDRIKELEKESKTFEDAYCNERDKNHLYEIHTTALHKRIAELEALIEQR